MANTQNKCRFYELYKMPRPHAIIPYRENTLICNEVPKANFHALNVSPLLYTPKIRSKTNIKKAEESFSIARNGVSDERKIAIVAIKNLSSRKVKDIGNYKRNGSLYENSNKKTIENCIKNKTFHEDGKNVNKLTIKSKNTSKCVKPYRTVKLSSKNIENSFEKTNKIYKGNESKLGNKLILLKDYLNSLASTKSPSMKTLIKTSKNISFSQKTNTKPQNITKSLEKNKSFLTSNQKTDSYLFKTTPINKITKADQNKQPKFEAEEFEQSLRANNEKFKRVFTEDNKNNINKKSTLKSDIPPKKSFQNPLPIIPKKKMSLFEKKDFDNLNKKKLSIAEISSILNSEELLKQKFKENLHNILKFSNEGCSTNDDMTIASQMKKNSDFSINLRSEFIRNSRKESIPNLLVDEEERECGNEHGFIAEEQIENFLKQIEKFESEKKVKSNLEISDIVQRLSSTKKINEEANIPLNLNKTEQDIINYDCPKLYTSNQSNNFLTYESSNYFNPTITKIGPKSPKTSPKKNETCSIEEKQEKKPLLYYEELFDFNRSFEDIDQIDKSNISKLSNRLNISSTSKKSKEIPFKKPKEKNQMLLLNNKSDFDENDNKQFSPKCESTTKMIKPLYNYYNNQKFASPLMNPNKKRGLENFFDDMKSFEQINPNDEFYDDI